MLQVQANIDLFPFNTFKVSAKAHSLLHLTSVEQLNSLELEPQLELFSLGEGANTLFVKDFPGVIIKNELKGKKILSEDSEFTTIEVAAGENWHEFVMWVVEQNLSGIENLAYIPGTVGAAPVQNLAAYGQNFGEVIETVSGIYIKSPNQLTHYPANQLKLYYRDSIFKHDLKNKFIITSVTVKLSKKPKFDTNYHGSKPYESLQGELNKINPDYPSIPYTPKMVALAVTNQRKIKLPDWHVIGTAGSFFKNPFVSTQKFADLQKEMPDIQAYPINAMLYPNPDDPALKLVDTVKIPAGKLLDQLGWRGKTIGRVGTHEKHALIIVNHGGATGEEILDFSKLMQEDIKKHYQIDLEPEVNIINPLP